MEPDTTDDKRYQTVETTQEARIKMQKKILEKRLEDRKQELVEVVMRQTDYDEDKARDKLNEHNYDVHKTVIEYMNPSKEKEVKKISKNQMLYGEFRRFLDDASETHRRRQAQEEMRNQYMQTLDNKGDKK